MTKEELAALLDGREYGEEITREEEKAAKDAGLVVIFGASDDLVEFRGAIDDEIEKYGGGEFLLDAEGPMPEERDNYWSDDEMAHYFARKANALTFEAVWCGQDLAPWVIIAPDGLPYGAFAIVEGEESFCRGIVIAVADLPEGPETEA